MSSKQGYSRGEIPFVPWDEFLARHFVWKQGEHVTLIGPTGQGKTTLAKVILRMRKYVVVLITKRKDELIGEFKREGYRVVKDEWIHPHQSHPKVLLWPPYAKDEPRERHQLAQFRRGLDRVFDDGSWTVFVDEGHYVIEELNLIKKMKRLWQEARSSKITVVVAAQRPRFLPLAAYSQATHLFFWRNQDESDSKRLGGLGGLDRKLIERVVATLGEYEVLYVNTRTGALVVTKVQL